MDNRCSHIKLISTLTLIILNTLNPNRKRKSSLITSIRGKTRFPIKKCMRRMNSRDQLLFKIRSIIKAMMTVFTSLMVVQKLMMVISWMNFSLSNLEIQVFTQDHSHLIKKMSKNWSKTAFLRYSTCRRKKIKTNTEPSGSRNWNNFIKTASA